MGRAVTSRALRPELFKGRARCGVAVVAASVAGALRWRVGAARCFAGAGGGAAWPETRFWVQRRPDGSAAVGHSPSPAADILAFDAYSQERPGTREVRLGGHRFFAFASPRLGAEQIVVWRRTEDVRAAAEDWMDTPGGPGQRPLEVDADLPLRLTTLAERPQLTAAVWCWDKQNEKGEGVKDPMRYWDDGSEGGEWMYWESFWVPTEPAQFATDKPAFGDAAGAMLSPLLGDFDTLAAATSREPQAAAMMNQPEDENVVGSTAIGKAQKDRAYAVVYQFNIWGSDVSRSGCGSDFWSPEARLAVTALEAVVSSFGVRTVLDCACGDATWMVPYFVRQHPEVSYTGVDIVPEVIEQNRARHPDVDFLALDLAEAPLPAGSVDLIFSKETVNHMDLNDALAAIRSFAATGARYLLTNVHEGADNSQGLSKKCFTTYVKYDFELPPFNLKKVARVVEYQGLATSYSLFELS